MKLVIKKEYKLGRDIPATCVMQVGNERLEKGKVMPWGIYTYLGDNRFMYEVEKHNIKYEYTLKNEKDLKYFREMDDESWPWF